MSAPSRADCSVPDCGKESKAAGLCWMHAKRKQRGQPLSAPPQERLSPLQRLIEAAVGFRDAEDGEVEFKRSVGRLCYAAARVRATPEDLAELEALLRRSGVGP